VAAISPNKDGDDLLRDWELVGEMNSISLLSGIKKVEISLPPDDVETVDTEISKTTAVIESRLNELALPFKIPSCELLAVMLPQA